MRILTVSAVILIGSLTAALACPEASDMTKGVQLKTVSPRGEGNTFTYRKTGPGRVTELRKSQWISVSNTVERELVQGLLPVSQKVLKAPKNSQVLQDETYKYAGQNIAGLAFEPNSRFTLNIEKRAADGFTKKTVTTYHLGAVKSRKVAGCRLNVMQIRAVEDWDGIETEYTYSYFPDLGFGVQLKAKYPGKTYTREILEIDAAKR